MPSNDALTVSSEIVMVIGFGMTTLGFATKMLWWTFGGLLLWFLGVMTLDSASEAPSAPVGARPRINAYEVCVLAFFAYCMACGVVFLTQRTVTDLSILLFLSCICYYGLLLTLPFRRRVDIACLQSSTSFEQRGK